VSRARTKKRKERAPKKTSSAYERASCEYQISIGLKARSPVRMRPTRRLASWRPIP